MLLEGSHYDSAIDHYKQAIELCDDAWPALEGLARCLGSQGKYAELMWALQSLHDIEDHQREGTSLLVRLLVHGEYIISQMGNACARNGRPQLALDALDKALEVVDADDACDYIKVWLPYQIATFKYHYYGLWEEGAKLWGIFLERLSAKGEKFQSYFSNWKKWARNRLSQHYFDTAVQSWKLTKVCGRSARTSSGSWLSRFPPGWRRV